MFYFTKREIEAPNPRWQVVYEQVDDRGRIVNAGLWRTFQSHAEAQAEAARMRYAHPEVLPVG